MDNEDLKISYITDTIPSLPASHQLPDQAKRSVLIIAIKREAPNTDQGAIDKINHYQTPHGESNVNISICKGRATREQILKIFAPYLINSDL